MSFGLKRLTVHHGAAQWRNPLFYRNLCPDNRLSALSFAHKKAHTIV